MTESKLYMDEDWLFEQYINKKKSTCKISKEIECSQRTILNWLKRFNIPIRSLSEAGHLKRAEIKYPYQKKDWLYNQYINLRKSMKEIGKEVDRSYETIRFWLKKFDIPIRKYSELVGDLNPNWKGGRRKGSEYWHILRPNHPKATKTGYILEHILVAEKKLGRPLKHEEVSHHINNDGYDNRPENIWIAPDQSAHQRAHGSLNKLINPLLEKGIITFNNDKGEYEII